MIPSLDSHVLHYEGLKEVGGEEFLKCDRCGEWKWCKLYKEQFEEGLQGHVRRVCKSCLEVE